MKAPAEDDQTVLALLEPDQVVSLRRPLNRRRLSRGTVVLFSLLRTYVALAVGLILYAFWRAFHS